MVDNGQTEHAFGCYMVADEGDGWQRVTRGASHRPRPQGVTIGDMISNSFKALMKEKNEVMNEPPEYSPTGSFVCTDILHDNSVKVRSSDENRA